MIPSPSNKQVEFERHYGWYCLAFLDVLGQSAAIRKLLSAAHDEAQLKEALSKTAGYILGLRQQIDEFFKGARAIEAHVLGLPPEVQARITQANDAVKYSGFSDSFVMAICFEGDQDQFVPMNGVYRCLVACCMLQLVALCSKGPIRGGIEVEHAYNLTEKEVYGPVLHRAYYLESRIADYPRILIGDGMLRYLDTVEGHPATTLLGKISKQLASKAKQLIVFDNDGFPMLHFLGKPMFDLWSPEKRQSIFAKAHDYVEEKKQTAKSTEDHKLLSRYHRLCSYFDSHAAMWNEKG
jgi:hypothetical protein